MTLTSSDIDTLLGITPKGSAPAQPKRLRLVPGVQQKLEITAIVDTYAEQHCGCCAEVDFLHTGRMIEERGNLIRVLRKPRPKEEIKLVGLPYRRETIRLDIPLCYRCSLTLSFAQDSLDLIQNGGRQLELSL